MRWNKLGIAVCVATIGISLCAAATVEEAIAKHVAARGGAANWDKIHSMKLTGSFTAFSKVSPFTLHRKRESNYHMDHQLAGKLVVIGYDGKTAWWDNRFFQEGAQEIRNEHDLGVVVREADFLPPLLASQREGFGFELLGEIDLEGQKTLGIKVTRPGGVEETWYLDPSTYLEVARDSPGSDFGNPMPQRSYFDDFREVGGVLVPYFVETQWYTRDRVMAVDRIEVNVDIDDAMFRMPAPVGMAPLLPMVGSWDVAGSTRQQPGAPWTDSKRTSQIESLLGGGLLRESFTGPDGTSYLRTLSYDRFRKVYRLTQIDNSTTFLDIEEGDFDEAGRLVVSNMASGTTKEMFGLSIHSRIAYIDITDAGFNVEVEVSIDGGENWWVAAKAAYTRQAE